MNEKDFFIEICRRISLYWMPREYNSEKEYETDLFRFLDGTRKNPAIILKTKSNADNCDISIEYIRNNNYNIGIELKYNLTSKSNVDRLIGQVLRYSLSYKNGIIIVLVGKTDASCYNDIRKFVTLLSFIFANRFYFIFDLRTKRFILISNGKILQENK